MIGEANGAEQKGYLFFLLKKIKRRRDPHPLSPAPPRLAAKIWITET